jgi:hypothetical protein
LTALFLFAALVTIVSPWPWPRSGNHDRIKQIAHFGPSRALHGAPSRAGLVSTGGRIARTALAAQRERRAFRWYGGSHALGWSGRV